MHGFTEYIMQNYAMYGSTQPLHYWCLKCQYFDGINMCINGFLALPCRSFSETCSLKVVCNYHTVRGGEIVYILYNPFYVALVEKR